MLSKNAIDLLTKRYCRDETPDHVYKRTLETLSMGDEKFAEHLYYLMTNGIFLPNSPALFNSGFTNMMHACCALGIDDSMRSIVDFIDHMTLML